MWFAIVPFLVSLVLIAALFSLRWWEIRHERVLAPAWRERADERARELKDALLHSNRILSRIPPLAAILSRYLVHEIALGLAALARFSERQAHALADMVSHKHRFERRETQSDFLKQVADRKSTITETR
ncbi:hypothetical protein FJY94_02350 [Candidatus Kaiserbacteria bacterium]|nr:hypothetical protein [Candidatus Kaiserbacteria bacterium]